MLGWNDACQQNVVLFELVEEILFDVEALSITYSSLVEPWHVAMSCWRYSSPKVLHFQKASVLSLEPQTSSTGEMAFPWGQLWQVFAEPVRAIVDSMARVVHSMRKGCPKTESTWMREAVHWSPFFLHFLESIIESFFCNFVVGRPTDPGKKYKVQFDYLIVSSPYLWRFVVRLWLCTKSSNKLPGTTAELMLKARSRTFRHHF